jgi:hypothetical protein
MSHDDTSQDGRHCTRRSDPQEAAERTATATGFAGSVLGAVGGPAGATVGGLVAGTAGYLAGYTTARASPSREHSETTDDGPVTVSVDEEGSRG